MPIRRCAKSACSAAAIATRFALFTLTLLLVVLTTDSTSVRRHPAVTSSQPSPPPPPPPRHKPELRINISTRDVFLHPGQTASVKCQVRVGSRALDSLRFGFSMLFGAETSLPLTSTIPGVLIHQWPLSHSAAASTPRDFSGGRSRRPAAAKVDSVPSMTSSRQQQHRRRQQRRRLRRQTIELELVLSPPVFRFLAYGQNKFCCTASVISPSSPPSSAGKIHASSSSSNNNNIQNSSSNVITVNNSASRRGGGGGGGTATEHLVINDTFNNEVEEFYGDDASSVSASTPSPPPPKRHRPISPAASSPSPPLVPTTTAAAASPDIRQYYTAYFTVHKTDHLAWLADDGTGEAAAAPGDVHNHHRYRRDN